MSLALTLDMSCNPPTHTFRNYCIPNMCRGQSTLQAYYCPPSLEIALLMPHLGCATEKLTRRFLSRHVSPDWLTNLTDVLEEGEVEVLVL